MDNQLPLSPPKKILERLTPVKKITPILASRRSPTYRPKRTPSTSSVLQRVCNFKIESRLMIIRRKVMIKEKHIKAHLNRKEILKSRSDQARRLSNDSKIWESFKVKVDYKNISAIEDDGDDNDSFEINAADAGDIISKSVEKMLVKRRCEVLKGYSFFTTGLEETLKTDSYNSVLRLITSKKFETDISFVLQYLKLPNFNSKLSITNVFLHSLIILSDHYSSGPRERAYDTSLGNSEDYEGYKLKGYKELHYDNDLFYDYLVSRMLRLSRKLLVSFQLVLNKELNLYNQYHLKLLKVWKEYVGIFHIFNNFHLNRSLLLLLKAFDIFESGAALQEQVGLTVDYSRRDFFKKQKKLLEIQIYMNLKRNNDSMNNWFSFGLKFKARIDDLYTSYLTFESDLNRTDSQFIIPPGFTVNEWRHFRLNRILNQLKVENVHLKSGRTEVETELIEFEMEKIGLKPFREFVNNIDNLNEVIPLVEMLFNCIGLKPTKEQESTLKNLSDPDYLVTVQSLFKSLSKKEFKTVTTIKEFLQLWRSLMNQYTLKWINHSISLCPNYTTFELNMFKYQLSRTNQTLEEYKEDVLPLYLIQRPSINSKILLLEHIFYSSNQRIATLGHIEPMLTELLEKTNTISNTIKFLWCISSTPESKETLIRHQLNNSLSTIAILDELKELIDVHFLTYQHIYESLQTNH